MPFHSYARGAYGYWPLTRLRSFVIRQIEPFWEWLMLAGCHFLTQFLYSRLVQVFKFGYFFRYYNCPFVSSSTYVVLPFCHSYHNIQLFYKYIRYWINTTNYIINRACITCKYVSGCSGGSPNRSVVTLSEKVNKWITWTIKKAFPWKRNRGELCYQQR